MTDIVIGTTPTITYTFTDILPADISVAVLTIKKQGTLMLEKDLSDATITEESISWTLSQEDTLDVGTGNVEIMINWLTLNGIRGVSKKNKVNFIRNHINEVITNE